MMIACKTNYALAANFLIFFLFFAFIPLKSATPLEWKVVSQEAVDIKPGAGLQEISSKAGKHVCKFYYKAQGGTKENWEFEVKKSSPSGYWRCGISRPSASYLFFEEFAFEVSSGYLQTVHLEKRPGSDLPETEYLIDPMFKTVKSNPSQFKSQLNSVQIEFSNKQQDKQEEL